MKFIRQEYQEIKSFFKNYFRVIVVLSLVIFSLVMAWYRPVGPSQASNQLFYYLIIPVLVIFFIFRENPLDYGLRLGNYSIWISYVAITILIGFPILFIASSITPVSKFYTTQFNYYIFFTSTVPILFAWEYLLRGFLLFGLKKQFGQASIVIQMVPFVLLHLGKPEAETVSCIFTGLWFGWVAYRGKSFWPAFIIHVFINFSVKYFVNF